MNELLPESGLVTGGQKNAVWLSSLPYVSTSETAGNPANKFACGSMSNHNRELQL